MGKDNIYGWLSGFTLSSTAIVSGWISVGTTVEVAFYGFIGGIAGILAKLFIQFLAKKCKVHFSNNK